MDVCVCVCVRACVCVCLPVWDKVQMEKPRSAGLNPSKGTRILRHARHLHTQIDTGNCSFSELYFRMGSGCCSLFVCFEPCASPLCPFDLLPSPKIEEN